MASAENPPNQKTRGKGSAKTRLRLSKADLPELLLKIELPPSSPVSMPLLQSLATAVDCAEQLCIIKSICV
jgi:hypothetical protein